MFKSGLFEKNYAIIKFAQKCQHIKKCQNKNSCKKKEHVSRLSEE